MTVAANINKLLEKDGPVAVVLRQYLQPVEGKDAPIYPPTYAAPKGETPAHPYNIDGPFPDGLNICLIDSVPSQANRIEPELGEVTPPLVPSVTIRIADQEVNLLDVGHRFADAIVRSSGLRDTVKSAIEAFRKGDAIPLAKLAPTSLVFGAWDSRDSGEKIPRIIQSVIRATNVDVLSRSSQYIPPVNYKDLDLIDDDIADEKLSGEGLLAVPAAGAHGGVRVRGEIRRDATLNLVTLQAIAAPKNADALRRYVLGLSLVALLYPQRFNLRQGCLLVLDPERKAELSVVYHDGRREPLAAGYDDALAFAKSAAAVFGVGDNRSVDFDHKLLNVALRDKAAKKAKKPA